jgi:hypothetical protein
MHSLASARRPAYPRRVYHSQHSLESLADPDLEAVVAKVVFQNDPGLTWCCNVYGDTMNPLSWEGFPVLLGEMREQGWWLGMGKTAHGPRVLWFDQVRHRPTPYSCPAIPYDVGTIPRAVAIAAVLAVQTLPPTPDR